MTLQSRLQRIDPGILIHLLREEGVSIEQLDQMLNYESGLLGISGTSDDIRDLLNAAAQGKKRARALHF